ncbi:DUF6702 family protein [Cesiribacter sp. SM1]|uniref:DUF6702 family protein n=1 Tax=Cesiribacter sp. SM1 TaxID=2861196 RepID=UPI001CD6D044|nr:DUF6702 family protein [Cesiribacter sp. SM1]
MILNYLFLLIVGWFHPLHLSVSEVVLNPKSGSLEISHRIFLDDLEADLQERYGNQIDLINPSDPALVQELVGSYLNQHFRLQVNGKAVQAQYLGFEVEEDAIWAYMEVPKVRQLSSINVHNSLFFKRFNDQVNLVNVKVGSKIQSMRLQTDNDNGTLKW